MAVKLKSFQPKCGNPLSKHSIGGVLRIRYMTYIFIFKSQVQSVPKRRYRTYSACKSDYVLFIGNLYETIREK